MRLEYCMWCGMLTNTPCRTGMHNLILCQKCVDERENSRAVLSREIKAEAHYRDDFIFWLRDKYHETYQELWAHHRLTLKELKSMIEKIHSGQDTDAEKEEILLKLDSEIRKLKEEN